MTPADGSACAPGFGGDGGKPLLFIIDDECFVRTEIRADAERLGWAVTEFDTCEAFLAADRLALSSNACLVVDAHLPGMDGLDFFHHLRRIGCNLPMVMISGTSDIAVAVTAMKAGVDDFLEKPLSGEDLMCIVGRAVARATLRYETRLADADAARHVAGLTQRQAQVMELVVAGRPTKIIAATLGVSQRTVETHRAAIMRKMGAKSIPDLARLAMAAVAGGRVVSEPDLWPEQALTSLAEIARHPSPRSAQG